ncbi:MULTISPECIES: cobaltochelatase CobT-related protein [Klebsiella]|uniref:Cobalamin biosynthesis protein CobT n=1 Tax=Klebsiella michiganensis TaxID=1134687 RepID=A0AAJ1KT93_9ENTR|nr:MULTISPECIES: cobalamin biosynthesis protein CobT [Klebsiella]MDH0964459.1 cobalamin biosynthesis protein CobT [Klebsiella michiganensis]
MKKTSVKDITKFREAIKNVVSMLVARNIPVIERGDKAYVEYNKAGEPLCICIPSIPDDASDKFLMAVRGFIDHEVAHVLFTDSTKATSFVWNAVEDTFIERKMGEMFKGSRANLINTQKHVIDTVFIPKEMEAIAEKLGDQTRMFMEFYLVPVLRAWNDQTPFIDYMEDRWERVKEPVSILIKHGVDKMIPKISSTSDSVAVAALIVRLLVDKPMESEDPGESKENGEGKGKSSSESSHDDCGDGDLPWHGDDEPEDSEEKDSPGSVDNEEGETESADDGDGGDGGSSKSEEDKKADGIGDEPGDSESGAGDIPKPTKGDLERLESTELPKGAMDMSMEGAMKMIISSESELSTGYRPYERTYDFMGRLEHASEFFRNVLATSPKGFHMYGDADNYMVIPKHEAVFNKKIKPLIGDDIVATLAKDLERTIASQNRNQFVPGQRRGRLHGPSLYRLSVDDDRVFRKLEVKRAVNSCVQIVIDMSGSMRGQKIKTACAAAYTLADALARINVKTMITGFTTSSLAMPGKSEFNRSEALFLPIIKGWETPISSKQTICNLGALAGTMILAENIDGESILALLQHFSGRQEDRKIMIVLSDGSPAAQGRGLTGHLKMVTKQIEQDTDIHLLGIGILTDAPRHFYRDNICLNNVGDLAETLIKQMQRLLS